MVRLVSAGFHADTEGGGTSSHSIAMNDLL